MCVCVCVVLFSPTPANSLLSLSFSSVSVYIIYNTRMILSDTQYTHIRFSVISISFSFICVHQEEEERKEGRLILVRINPSHTLLAIHRIFFFSLSLSYCICDGHTNIKKEKQLRHFPHLESGSSLKMKWNEIEFLYFLKMWRDYAGTCFTRFLRDLWVCAVAGGDDEARISLREKSYRKWTCSSSSSFTNK